MNAQEAALHYPFADQLPVLGDVKQVADGIFWVRMQLPFALDHINLWLLRDQIDGQDGWCIVDCGISNEATQHAWEQIFAQHLQGLPVLRIVVTHMHPDHVGNAWWLEKRWQCPVWMSATDYNAARLASQSTTGFGGAAAAAHFSAHGLTDEESLAKIRARASYYPSMVPHMPMSFHRLLGGQTLRIGANDWSLHTGYGHAPEHISLYSAHQNVLISGDMVLPRISTNVSVIDIEPQANPLPLYLQSIEQMRALPADALVLPSHGKPFQHLHTRIDQLQQHHDDRLADALQACKTAPQTAASLVPVLFKRTLDLHQTTFAMGESLAHLHALWFEGKVSRTLSQDGVYYFAA